MPQTDTIDAFEPTPQLGDLIARLSAVARRDGAHAYIVGGAVRDVLLRRPPRDLDLAVAGGALSLAEKIARAFGGVVFVMHEEHAVARVMLPEPIAGVEHIDVGTLHGTLEQDLRRRDLTIDACAVELGSSAVIDVSGGRQDVRAGIVRAVAPAAFEDDPLRLLRAPRIAGELGFGIAPETAAAVRERASRLSEAPGERQRDELARILTLANAHGAVRLLDALALLDVLLPELTFGRGITQPQQFHAYDVFEHNLHALEAMDLLLDARRPSGERAWMWDTVWEAFGWCEKELRAEFARPRSAGFTTGSLLKLATLLHDVAKPQTRTQDADGRVRFFGHADEGARVVARIMRRLLCSGADIGFVALLVKEHLRPVQLAPVGQAPTPRAIYRFVRDLEGAAPAVLLLALADGAAARGDGLEPEAWARQVAYMNSLLVRSRKQAGIVHAPRLLTGRDIMESLRILEGPAVGRILERLREAEAVGEVQTREQALAFIRSARVEGDSSA